MSLQFQLIILQHYFGQDVGTSDMSLPEPLTTQFTQMTEFTDSYTGHQASLSQNREMIMQFRHKKIVTSSFIMQFKPDCRDW